MTTVKFLASLNSLGIKIWLEDNQLRYRAAKGVMTASIKQELVERKTEIIRFIKETEKSQLLSYKPIVPIHKNFDLPLSFSQQRLWFLHHLDSDSPFYNESLQLRIIGALNVSVLEQSINEIIRRHEALRTIFPTVDGLPVQRIIPSLTIDLPVVDLQGLKEAEVQQIITQKVRQPFDLSKPPVFRVSLLRLGSESHLLILTIHHIVIDGWSIGILLEELSALYQAFSIGSPTPLPELNIQYGDFTVWQRQWLTEQLQQQQLNYWKQQLADAPRLLELPRDYPRPSVQSFSGAIKTFQINSNLTKELKNISQQSGTTLFVTLLTAFAVLLHRYSGQDDICIGSPFANRNCTEIEGLIGFFVNTLVLRTQIKDNPTFLKFVTQVQQVVLDGYAHQDVPFDQVVEALQPERSLSYNPLFQVMFVLENFALDAVELPGITLTPELVERGTAQCDLSLALWETKTGLMGSWEYNTDLFKADTIARMTGHFQTLLEAIAANPQQKISQLPLLTETERHQLLVEWNNTEIEYPFDKCIHQLFEEQVELTPDAVAVVFEGKQLTYRELNAKANQLAHYLQTLGVKPDVLVGIYVERSFEMIVGILGILKAGGAYVPIDAAYPSERIAYILDDSQLAVLLTQEKLVASLPEHQAWVVCMDSDWEEISKQSELSPYTCLTPENLAYVIYTSGSTGKPKGVLIPHSGLLNLVFWHQHAFEVTLSDRATQLAGTAFDASVWEIWPYLASGASIYLIAPEIVLSPEKLKAWLLTQQITITFVPTPIAEKLLSLQWPSDGALRVMLTGGDKLHQYPSASIPFKIVNNYGPTENTVVTTSGLVVCDRTDNTLPHIGRPIGNTQVYILDRYLQPVPIGVPGELHIASVGLAKGYLNQPDLTQEKFIPNLFSNQSSSRLYKTGDLARYLPDGNIEFLGRIDNQVKVRGFRIELGEIEAAIAQHPAIRETIVIVRDFATDDKQLVAYIVPCQEPAPAISDLRHFLKQQLPDYMIPSAFVVLEALPLTPNGKVDRKSLPPPDINSLIQKADFVAPGTPTEKLVASIWSKVLGVEKVGINDNFFELGGHSLLATQLIAKVKEDFGIEFPLSKFFEAPTVACLSSYIEAIFWAKESLETSHITINNVEEVEF